MTDRILQDGVVVQVNDQPQQIERLRGLGLTADLAASEAASWRRWLPGGRLPWSELGFEEEIGRLEHRRQEIEAKRGEAHVQLQAAPEGDLESLAAWERSGRSGPRPEPRRAALEAELARLQEEELGLLRAIDQVSASRAAHVSKNRPRLEREASQAAEKAHERVERALDEVEAARAALVEARRVSLWASLYPSETAGREPAWGALAGGLRRVGEMMGLQQAVAAESVFSALRADADWLASAASAEQRAVLEPRQITPEERDRARDKRLEGHAALHRQRAADQRHGDLNNLKGRI